MISMDCRMSKRFLSKSHIKTYKKKKAVKLNGDLFSDKADSRFFCAECWKRPGLLAWCHCGNADRSSGKTFGPKYY